jgi:hypothetical protein
MMKKVHGVIDCSGGSQMKVREAVRLISMAAILLGFPGCSGSGRVHETDDPVTVVREAWRAFLADNGRTCHEEVTNNSGPGSLEETLIEVQGRDRIHMVSNNQGGPNPGHSEFIFIGNDKYFRLGNESWQKYPATKYLGKIPFGNLSEIVDDNGLKLVRGETIEGSPISVREHVPPGRREHQEYDRRHLDRSERPSYPQGPEFVLRNPNRDGSDCKPRHDNLLLRTSAWN